MKTIKTSIAQIATTVILSAASSVAFAANITTLFNTGVDASGNVLADGTIGDPHYTLISVPSGSTSDIRIRTSVGGYPIGPYIGDNSSSTWIGPNNDAIVDGPVGSYTYRTTFDLTGFAANTASISGGWSTDNNGLDILINGVSLGYATSFTSFSSGFSTFSVTNGFVAGINTLDFVVNNGGGPTALRVEMTGRASAVPVPAAAWLLGSGLLGLAGVARKRKAA